MTVQEAVQAVIDEGPQTGQGAYAQTYARAARRSEIEYGEEGLRVQCLYILSNLGGWRGERAREVKAVLKAFSKTRVKVGG